MLFWVNQFTSFYLYFLANSNFIDQIFGKNNLFHCSSDIHNKYRIHLTDGNIKLNTCIKSKTSMLSTNDCNIQKLLSTFDQEQHVLHIFSKEKAPMLLQSPRNLSSKKKFSYLYLKKNKCQHTG